MTQEVVKEDVLLILPQQGFELTNKAKKHAANCLDFLEQVNCKRNPFCIV